MFSKKELINLICKEGAIDILVELRNRKSSFSELRKKVRHTTLAKRLKELEKEGLIERKILAKRPPRTEYTITELGLKVLSIIEELKDIKNDN